MRSVARWHVWLGWLVAIPLLIWTASGLFMVARSIEEVRGTELRSETPTLDLRRLTLPRTDAPVKALKLVAQRGEPRWVVEHPNHRLTRFDAGSGLPLGSVDAAEARALASAAVRVPGAIVGVDHFPAESAPIDLRKPRPSWRTRFDNGNHVYIDADTGEFLALRSRLWRWYDIAWGLHIMDPVKREDTSHPLLIGTAALSFISVVLGTMLLFRRRRRQRAAK